MVVPWHRGGGCVFCSATSADSPLARVVVSHSATCAGGASSSSHWFKYCWVRVRVSCSIMYFLCLNLQSGILLCTTPICVVPVINSVSAKVLSLRDVQITIILNETGGQPVENTVSHYTLCIVACCHANTSLRCFLSVICCCFLSVTIGLHLNLRSPSMAQ